jgi:glycine cleavage system H protein
MLSHSFLSMYGAKLAEYSLAIFYLLAFVPFWRYVQGGRPAPVAVLADAPALGQLVASWFHIPEQIFLHPGHTWARPEANGLVAVGLDDFAQKLVAPDRVALPAIGAQVAQGDPAVRLATNGKSVSLLSPVEGTVVEVNPKAQGPESAADPYGSGWLFKVKAPRLSANLKQLLSGAAARRWLEEAGEALGAQLSPELGRVYQDGGVPIRGIARELDPEHWDELARKFFLS